MGFDYIPTLGDRGGISVCYSLLTSRFSLLATSPLTTYNLLLYDLKVLVRLKEWLTALAMAPSVSIEYWRELCAQYTHALGQRNAMPREMTPFLVASGDTKGASSSNGTGGSTTTHRQVDTLGGSLHVATTLHHCG